jgi:hypothetical protein
LWGIGMGKGKIVLIGVRVRGRWILMVVSELSKVSKVVYRVLLLVVVADMLIYCWLIHCNPNCTHLVNAVNHGSTRTGTHFFALMLMKCIKISFHALFLSYDVKVAFAHRSSWLRYLRYDSLTLVSLDYELILWGSLPG